jgi:hypothetical protein
LGFAWTSQRICRHLRALESLVPQSDRIHSLPDFSVLLRLASIALVHCLLCLQSAGQDAKAESIGALTDSVVPDAIRQVLAAKGARIQPDSNGVLEIWFRNQVPPQAKSSSSDAIYDRLAESTLLGVLHFPQAGQDYRGQSIAAGFYTLRYALMPNDGNHMGVAPSRDFLLLVPAGADPGPEKILKFQDLVGLSRKAAGTKHPAPLSLVQAEAKPPLSKNEDGNTVFTSAVHLSSGEEMPIALIVKGTAPQ